MGAALHWWKPEKLVIGMQKIVLAAQNMTSLELRCQPNELPVDNSTIWAELPGPYEESIIVLLHGLTPAWNNRRHSHCGIM